MKKIILLLWIMLILVYCKTKKNSVPEVYSGSSSADKIIVPQPSLEKELVIAQKRWAGTTAEELQEGKNIFYGKCTQCHAPKKITGRSEERWVSILEDMALRAKLTKEEKFKLAKYVLSYLEVHEK